MVSSEDEILVRDKTGKFKILRGGKFYDLEETAPAKSAISGSSSQVDKILKQIRFRIDENLKGRLADIIEAYLKDVRDRYETKSIFTRETKNGGMGFLPDQADIIIDLIKKIGNKKEEKKEEASSRVSKIEITPEKTVLPQKDVKKAESKDKMDLSEGKIAPSIIPREKTELEKKVDEIIKESAVRLPDNEEMKLKNILLTHLKDIRDGFELQDTLTSAFSTNILSKEKVNKILEIAKKKSKGDEEDLRWKKLEEIKEALEAEQRRREMVFEENQSRLSDKLKNRWQEITKRKETAPISLPEERSARPEKERPEILSLVEFADFLDGEKREEVREEQISKNIVSQPILKEEPIISQALPSASAPASVGVPADKTGDKPSFAEASAFAKATADKPADKPKPLQVFKPVSIPFRRPPPIFRKDQPRLDDIKYIPKIVGPIDELRDMTLVNFRRLGASPEEAVVKIKEKLDILEHDSVMKRLAGIKAWQEAEVTKIYLEISRECLSKGASADQIISLRESSGRPTLTAEEYKAVLELNKFLRY